MIASLLARLAIPGEIPWLETWRSNFTGRRGEGVPLVLERGTAIALRPPSITWTAHRSFDCPCSAGPRTVRRMRDPPIHPDPT